MAVNESAALRSMLAMGCACLSTGFGVPVSARANADDVVIVHAPQDAQCVSGDALAERVALRAGRPASAAPGGGHVEVTIARGARAGFRAQVSSFDGHGQLRGQRELVTEEACSALDDMLVLVIASSVGVTSEPEPASPPTREKERIALVLEPPHSQPVPVATAADGGSPRPSPPWDFELGALAALGSGLWPRIGFVTGLSLSAMPAAGALGVRVAASWLPSLEYASNPQLQLRMTGGFAELALCARAARNDHLALQFCAGAMGGALRAEAGLLWKQEPRWDGLLAVSPRVMARLQPWSRAGVDLGLGSNIPIFFPKYAYTNAAGQAVPVHAAELGVFAEITLWMRIHP